jgi:hypothetical protein
VLHKGRLEYEFQKLNFRSSMLSWVLCHFVYLPLRQPTIFYELLDVGMLSKSGKVMEAKQCDI